MIKKIIASVFIVFVLFACEEEKRPCEKNNTFNLELTNGSSDPYNVYVNNKFILVVAGKKKETIAAPAGFAKITVEQKSGYILYPTVKEYESTISACESHYLVFP